MTVPPLSIEDLDLGGAVVDLSFLSDGEVAALVRSDDGSRLGEAVRVDLATGESTVLAAGVSHLVPLAGGEWLVLRDEGVSRIGSDGAETPLVVAAGIGSVAASSDASVVAYDDLSSHDLTVWYADGAPMVLYDLDEIFDGAPLHVDDDGNVMARDADRDAHSYRFADRDAETPDVVWGSSGRVVASTVASGGGFRVAALDLDWMSILTLPGMDHEVDPRPAGVPTGYAAFVAGGRALLQLEGCDRGCEAPSVLLARYADGAERAEVLGSGPLALDLSIAKEVAASPDARSLAIATRTGITVVTAR